jgi:hypothetical protein
VERLAVARVIVVVMAAGFEQVAPVWSQSDHHRVSVEADRVDKARITKVPQVAMTRVQGPLERVTEIARGHDAERSHGGQRAAFRATQRVIVISVVDVLPVEAAREAEVFRKHVARVYALARIRSISAQGVAVSIARIVPERGS